MRTPASGSVRSTCSRNCGPSCHQWPNSSVSHATTATGAGPPGSRPRRATSRSRTAPTKVAASRRTAAAAAVGPVRLLARVVRVGHPRGTQAARVHVVEVAVVRPAREAGPRRPHEVGQGEVAGERDDVAVPDPPGPVRRGRRPRASWARRRRSARRPRRRRPARARAPRRTPAPTRPAAAAPPAAPRRRGRCAGRTPRPAPAATAGSGGSAGRRAARRRRRRRAGAAPPSRRAPTAARRPPAPARLPRTPRPRSRAAPGRVPGRAPRRAAATARATRGARAARTGRRAPPPGRA